MTLFEKIRCLFTFGQGVALPLPNISSDTTPEQLFSNWFNDAQKAGILLPEAMSVSTVDSAGQPSCRMVLMKQHNADGIVFYTNYTSKKSQQLVNNNKVALLFHWNVLQRQVRIEGTVEKVSRQQSADYFHSRDRGSQIGAWASHQSQKILQEQDLKQQVALYAERFAKQDEVPHPEFWGGWRVKPHYFEFWQGRASRLHDRICFEQDEQDQWQTFKLNP
jgi:pyridoxamine 5'-phosphate oxidase